MDHETSTLQSEKYLKSLIEQAGFTQKEFAKRLGLAYSTVQYYVAGQRMPGTDISANMCRVLEISPKQLYMALGIDVTGIPDDTSQNN